MNFSPKWVLLLRIYGNYDFFSGAASNKLQQAGLAHFVDSLLPQVGMVIC
jgi:hypothetical protein